MATTKLNKEQQAYQKSMGKWFDTIEMDMEWHKEELAHRLKTIEYNKKRIAIHKEQLKLMASRKLIAKKAFDQWKKSVTKDPKSK